MRNFYYDATDQNCKSITGGIPSGDSVTFTLRLNRRLFAYHVQLVWRREGLAVQRKEMFWIGMELDENVYECTLIPEEPGLYFYWFEVDLYGRYLKLGCDLMHRAAELNPFFEFQMTVFEKGFQTPDWFKGGVMYHIFVDRFNRSRAYDAQPPVGVLRDDWGGSPEFRPVGGKVRNSDFFGGNLRGIIEKLDYLQSLGVNVLYLSPIFEAASNHKYDTADYLQIDPLFGNEEIFTELCASARTRGIRIILDGVFNHTGDDSRYFNKYGRFSELGAYQSRNSQYFDWYEFTSYPDKYRCWWGIDILPEIDRNCQSFQNFIAGKGGVIEKWMKAGASGFRLDVVDELTDAFTARIRRTIKDCDSEGLVIGEVWEDASNKSAYGKRKEYFFGRELDSCMNYPFRNGILDYVRTGNPYALSAVVRMIEDHYPKQVQDSLMNITGTHDTVRLITALSEKERPKKKVDRAAFRLLQEEREQGEKLVKLASLLQFTLPGVPCIYYGDEIGMEGYEDPFNRSCYDWNSKDSSLRDWFAALGRMRTLSPFREGNFVELSCDDGVYLFERRDRGSSIIVGINRGGEPFSFAVENYRDYFTGRKLSRATIKPEFGYLVLVSE